MVPTEYQEIEWDGAEEQASTHVGPMWEELPEFLQRTVIGPDGVEQKAVGAHSLVGWALACIKEIDQQLEDLRNSLR